MDNNKLTGRKDYAGILQQMSALLKTSFSEISNRYASYPHYAIDYPKKRGVKTTIEIRLEEEEITIYCTFNIQKKCSRVYLFPDNIEIIEGFIACFKESFDYDYLKNRWAISGNYVRFQGISKSLHDQCLVISGK